MMGKSAIDLIAEAIKAGRMQRVEPGAAEESRSDRVYTGPDGARAIAPGVWWMRPARYQGEG